MNVMLQCDPNSLNHSTYQQSHFTGSLPGPQIIMTNPHLGSTAYTTPLLVQTQPHQQQDTDSMMLAANQQQSSTLLHEVFLPQSLSMDTSGMMSMDQRVYTIAPIYQASTGTQSFHSMEFVNHQGGTINQYASADFSNMPLTMVTMTSSAGEMTPLTCNSSADVIGPSSSVSDVIADVLTNQTTTVSTSDNPVPKSASIRTKKMNRKRASTSSKVQRISMAGSNPTLQPASSPVTSLSGLPSLTAAPDSVSQPSPSTPAPINWKKCQVCEDRAVNHNFGQLTCESCKAFFRRNAHKKSKLKCAAASDTCQITSDTRKQCPSCRLSKCFQIGMRSDLIQIRKNGGNKPRPFPSTSQSSSVSPALSTPSAPTHTSMVSSQASEDPQMCPLEEALNAGSIHNDLVYNTDNNTGPISDSDLSYLWMPSNNSMPNNSMSMSDTMHQQHRTTVSNMESMSNGLNQQQMYIDSNPTQDTFTISTEGTPTDLTSASTTNSASLFWLDGWSTPPSALSTNDSTDHSISAFAYTATPGDPSLVDMTNQSNMDDTDEQLLLAGITESTIMPHSVANGIAASSVCSTTSALGEESTTTTGTSSPISPLQMSRDGSLRNHWESCTDFTTSQLTPSSLYLPPASYHNQSSCLMTSPDQSSCLMTSSDQSSLHMTSSGEMMLTNHNLSSGEYDNSNMLTLPRCPPLRPPPSLHRLIMLEWSWAEAWSNAEFANPSRVQLELDTNSDPCWPVVCLNLADIFMRRVAILVRRIPEFQKLDTQLQTNLARVRFLTALPILFSSCLLSPDELVPLDALGADQVVRFQVTTSQEEVLLDLGKLGSAVWSLAPTKYSIFQHLGSYCRNLAQLVDRRPALFALFFLIKLFNTSQSSVNTAVTTNVSASMTSSNSIAELISGNQSNTSTTAPTNQNTDASNDFSAIQANYIQLFREAIQYYCLSDETSRMDTLQELLKWSYLFDKSLHLFSRDVATMYPHKLTQIVGELATFASQ